MVVRVRRRPRSGSGGLSRNIYASVHDDPEDRSAIDGYQLVWTIWRSNSDEEMQLEIAWAIFLEITRTVCWPAALVHDLDLLVATWDPERGLRRFPPFTSVDLQASRRRASGSPHGRGDG